MLEAGRPDYRWDVFIHMPAALTYPIGSRFYDWKYESEPEAHLGGRRLPRAGQGPGRLVEHQRHDLPAGQPGRLREVGSRAGDGALGLRATACRTSNEWRPASPGLTTGEAATDRSSRARARPPGRCSPPGSTPAPRRVSAAPTTSTACGRRASPPSTRTSYEADGSVRPGPICTPSSTGRTWTSSPGPMPNGSCSTERRPRASSTGIGAVAIWRVDARSSHAAARSTRHSFSSCPVSAIRPTCESVGVDVVADVRGVGQNLQDHLEVYVQHACTQPVSMQPYLAKWRAPWIGLQWLARRGPAATNHFEAGAFLKSNPDEPYPNLMFHFLPIAVRYDGTAPPRPPARPVTRTAIRYTSARCTPTPGGR